LENIVSSATVLDQAGVAVANYEGVAPTTTAIKNIGVTRAADHHVFVVSPQGLKCAPRLFVDKAEAVGPL
jgi:hypothetical protein